MDSITPTFTEYSEFDSIIALSVSEAKLVCSWTYFRWT
jgi:hypothetical protein